MRINIMQKGDRIINVTSMFIVVERKNCEVDIVPIISDETGFRVDTENITTIGYGNNTVQTETTDGVIFTNF